MTHSLKNKCRNSGFSLLEVITVVALLGIVSAMGLHLVTGVDKGVREQKLTAELKTLNNASKIFEAFGGDLSSISDPAGVIAKLKSVAKTDMVNRIPGLSGAMLDARTTAILQSDEEAASDQPRLYWSQEQKRFEIATSGPPGIKALVLSDSAPSTAEVTQRDAALYYAKDSNWIWDYSGAAKVGYLAPTVVPTSVVAASEVPSIDPSAGYPPESPASTLQSPLFSKAPGSYPILEYPLELSLTNPNPPGSSIIQYSIDFGSWQNYSASFPVSPGSVIRAVAVSNDTSQWRNSSIAQAIYSAGTEPLLPPTILSSADQFGAVSNHDIAVSLIDNNVGKPSKLEYRINGSEWTLYTESFVLNRFEQPEGSVIEARAISDNFYYLPSEVTSTIIGVEPLLVQASANGQFTNPTGPLNMVTNLNSQTPSSSYFEWGSVINPNTGNVVQGWSESSLNFTGGSGNGGLGDQIYLGNLDYFNGTISSGSGADGIDLALALTLQIGGHDVSLNFDFGFNLINVLNDDNALSNDINLAMASADFVQIDGASQTTYFDINGLQYSFTLEFGSAGENGFGQFDEFHVLEDLGSATSVFGTFEALAF